MANKRDLKKQIRKVCGDVAAEVIIAAKHTGNIEHDAMADIVRKLAELQVNSLAHSSFAFDKSFKDFESRAAFNKARSEYFKAAYAKLRKDFNEGVEDVVKEMNNARKK